MRVTFPRGFGEMTAATSEIDQAAESAEIEGRDDRRRGDFSEAVHAALEVAHGFRGAEEVGKDWAIQAEGLLPAVRSLAHGVFEMAPHQIKSAVGVADVAGESVGTVGAQVFFGGGGVDVAIALFFEQAESNAGVQQPVELVAIRRA